MWVSVGFCRVIGGLPRECGASSKPITTRLGDLLSEAAALPGIKETMVAQRINRAIELLMADQAIYYVGNHTGHVLTWAQGREDAGTWADYINVGMEHGAFDMTGLAEYLAGLVEGGPTRSGHRCPPVIVEAPVNGTDEANIRHNAW